MIYRRVAHNVALLLEFANVRETPVRGNSVKYIITASRINLGFPEEQLF